MRDIKFRFFSKATGRYVSNNSDYAVSGSGEIYHLLDAAFDKFEPVKSEYMVKEQYTGLKDMDDQELFDGDIVNIFYVRNGFIHDGNYLISINTTGIKFTFVGLPWSSYGYNQYPVHSYLIFSDYGILRSDYRNHDKPNSACISDHDGAEYSNYIKLIGNKHQNPELVGK